MESKFTKGDWEVNPRASRNVRCGNVTIANCSSGQNGENEEEEIANAQLIASAPDLLESLYELISLKKWKEEFGKDEWYLEKQPIAWEKAQKSLEKALVDKNQSANCTCKIPEPKGKCSENGIDVYCSKCGKRYNNQ